VKVPTANPDVVLLPFNFKTMTIMFAPFGRRIIRFFQGGA
jgi:hypothetical protein